MKTVVVETGDTVSREWGAVRGEVTDSTRLLLILSAGAESRVIELQGEPVTVGRGETATICLTEPSLSRVHARLHRSGDAVILEDLGSRNGTLVNGARVERAELRSGDVAVLGNVVLCIQLAPPARAAVLGLSSFEAIRGRIDQECARARTFRRPLSVVFLRADEPIGKGTFASPWASILRPSDIAGVYDARSVLVLLPETDGAAAEVLTGDLVAATSPRSGVVAGVASYPESAFTPDQLLSCAIAAAEQGRSAARITVAPSAAPVRASDPSSSALGSAVGKSPLMLELDRQIDRVAAEAVPVLVLGEAGTGKELVARELHRRSARRGAPLKVVNCAALTDTRLASVLFGHARGAVPGADRDQPGVFERASGGTVFLDEIGELPAAVQASLLHLLEAGAVCPIGATQDVAVNVRIVASTHRPLGVLVEQGTFRRDLFHRLNAFALNVPPLRERREEIAPLAAEFARRLAAGAEVTVSCDAMQLLEGYSWPGNVRELRNVIERAVMLATSGKITPAELPKHLAAALDDGPAASSPPSTEPLPDLGIDLRNELQRHEAGLIIRALQKTNGHQRRAAALLKLPLRTFERKLKDLGLNRAGLS